MQLWHERRSLRGGRSRVARFARGVGAEFSHACQGAVQARDGAIGGFVVESREFAASDPVKAKHERFALFARECVEQIRLVAECWCGSL
jgi:hypothetical protein